MKNRKNDKKKSTPLEWNYCERVRLLSDWINVFYWNGKIVKITLGPKGKGRPNPKLRWDIERALTQGIENSNLKFDLTGLTPFEKTVLNRCAKIKFGEVLSYGALAKAIGMPHSSRAVGRVMAKNPLPLLFPCHRVIHSDGRIGNFTAGWKTKRRLLENEGWQIMGNGTNARVAR